MRNARRGVGIVTNEVVGEVIGAGVHRGLQVLSPFLAKLFLCTLNTW